MGVGRPLVELLVQCLNTSEILLVSSPEARWPVPGLQEKTCLVKPF